MKTQKTAVLLMNVGSPDKPTVPAVRRYLTEFLNDKRVIDLPFLLRKFLVNLIIIPFRVKNSTKLYQQLWTAKGSPLIYLSNNLREKLQEKLPNNTDVYVGMRYGNPNFKKALSEIKAKKYQKIVLLPLFPQHAMSTTETSFVAAEKAIKKMKIGADICKVGQFYDHPKFIDAFAAQASKHDISGYDHVLFSYHGLPNRQLEKCHPGIKVTACNCAESMPAHGTHCYRATCYQTSRLIAARLNLKATDYSVAFQSRLSNNWLTPFTDAVLNEKLTQGKKKILVLAPSFVTDCLETTLEIGAEYAEEFERKGGHLQLVESLNTEAVWIEALAEIINTNTNKEL